MLSTNLPCTRFARLAMSRRCTRVSRSRKSSAQRDCRCEFNVVADAGASELYGYGTPAHRPTDRLDFITPSKCSAARYLDSGRPSMEQFMAIAKLCVAPACALRAWWNLRSVL